jgi:hypothetical protein
MAADERIVTPSTSLAGSMASNAARLPNRYSRPR